MEISQWSPQEMAKIMYNKSIGGWFVRKFRTHRVIKQSAISHAEKQVKYWKEVISHIKQIEKN